MRKLSTLIIPAVAGGLLVTMLPATSATAAKYVPPPLFGQHVASIASSAPTAPATLRAIRLWDAGVAWKDVEVADNTYNWSALDAAVANAKARGAQEILYTMGSTPRWAASDPNSALALYGPGSNSHPRSNSMYTDYLKAVAKRYPAITAFQVWNEANLRDFYLGTPAQMAQLTKDAKVALRSIGSRAKLVAASTTVRAKGPVGKFGKAYGKAMKKAKAWKYVDAVSAHFYPPATSGPGTRVSYMKKIKKYYKKYGAKKKPIWDTEMSYGDTRAYMKTKRQYTGTTAAAFVARTYIDSMRYGVSRVFWYGWDIHVLGTDMTSRADSSLTAGGKAFLEVEKWMSGARWYGCKTKKKITTCTIRPAGAGKQTIRFTTKKSKTMTIPKGVSVMRNLDGTSTPVSTGQKVRITTLPVLLA